MSVETCRGRVAADQCDDMGHLTVKEYHAFFGAGSWRFLEILGYDKVRMIGEGLGFVDLRHVIDFRRELKNGDEVRVMSDLVKIGTSSMTIHHSLLGPDDTLRAELTLVTVQFDLIARRGTQIHPAIRAAAMTMLDGK